MSAVLVTSTNSLSASSILVKNGIVRPWDGNPLTLVDDTDVQRPQYRMDLSMLESFFQSLNRQIYDQKCAVALNVSEQVYRQELAKRQELTTKVDTCLTDINMLRDFIYNDGHSALAHVDRIALLRGEIEALKMSFRRLELQNAESLELFARMKMNEQRVLKVEAEMNDMKKNDISETLHKDLERLKDNCKHKFGEYDKFHVEQKLNLQKKFDDYDRTIQDTIDNKLRTLESQVAIISDEFNAMMEDAAAEQAENDAILNNIMGDGLAPQGHVEQADPLLLAATTTTTTATATTGALAAVHEGTPRIVEQAEEDDGSDNNSEHDVFQREPGQPKPDYTEHLQRLADAHSQHPSSQSPHAAFNVNAAKKSLFNNNNSAGSIVPLPPSHTSTPVGGSRRSSSRLLIKRAAVGGGGGGGGGGMSSDDYKALVTAMGKMQAVIQNIQSNVHRIHAMRLRSIFEKWIETNLMQRKKHAFDTIRFHGERLHQLKVQATLKRWTKFSNPLKKILAAYQVKDYLYRWKRQVQRMAVGQRLKIWLRQRVTPWYRRAEPDLATFVERWKAFIVYSYRVQTIDRPTKKHPDGNNSNSSSRHASPHRHASMTPQELEREAEEIRVLANQNFDPSQYLGAQFTIANLKQMALKDLQRKWAEEEAAQRERDKWATLSHQFEHQFVTWQDELQAQHESKHAQLAQKLTTFEQEFHFSTKDIRRMVATFEESQKMIFARTEGNYQNLMGELSQLNSQINVRFTYMKEAFDDDHHRLERYVQQDVMHRIDALHVEWTQQLADAKQMLQQLQEHNQWKFDTLTSKTQQHDQHFERLRVQLADHHDRLRDDLVRLQTHTDDIAQLRKTLKEVTLFYDDEVNWLKQVAKESSRTFTEFKELYEKQLAETHNLLEALMSEEGSEERYLKMLATMASLMQRADKWYDKAALVSLQFINQPTATATATTTAEGAAAAKKLQQQYEHLFHRVRSELASQLSKVARRLAAYIALKSEEEVVMFYVRRHMLQHRHDGFYAQTRPHAGAATAEHATGTAKVVTMIDEIRSRYLRALQRELEAIFATANDPAASSGGGGPRPATASAATKVHVTTAAGSAVTAAERHHRRQLLITQFLLTVRQCLLAYPAVTTIAGLESVLKAKSHATFADAAACVSTSVLPLTTTMGGTTAGRDAGHGSWEDTCLACQRPILPAGYATAVPAAMMMHSPSRPSSPTVAETVPLLASTRSGGVLRPISPSPAGTVVAAGAATPTTPLAVGRAALRRQWSALTTTTVGSNATGGFKVLAHSQSAAIVPVALRQYRADDAVPLSPGAQQRLKLKDTLQRRGDRPFSAPPPLLQPASPAAKPASGPGRNNDADTAGDGDGDSDAFDDRPRRHESLGDFLHRQIGRQARLSVAAGVSMWLSVMLLALALVTHREETTALQQYLAGVDDAGVGGGDGAEDDHVVLLRVTADGDDPAGTVTSSLQRLRSFRANAFTSPSPPTQRPPRTTSDTAVLATEAAIAYNDDDDDALLRSSPDVNDYLHPIADGVDDGGIAATATGTVSSIAPEEDLVADDDGDEPLALDATEPATAEDTMTLASRSQSLALESRTPFAGSAMATVAR